MLTAIATSRSGQANTALITRQGQSVHDVKREYIKLVANAVDGNDGHMQWMNTIGFK